MTTGVTKEVEAAIERVRSTSEAYGRSDGAPALMRVEEYVATNTAYIELRAAIEEYKDEAIAAALKADAENRALAHWGHR